MTLDDLKASLKAGRLEWDEAHWYTRASGCGCDLCRAIAVASEAFERGVEHASTLAGIRRARVGTGRSPVAGG